MNILLHLSIRIFIILGFDYLFVHSSIDVFAFNTFVHVLYKMCKAIK